MKRRYEILDDTLYLIEPELDIHIVEPFAAKEHKEKNKEGKLVSSGFYLNEVLHGPCCFYSDSGSLFSRGWFYHGKRYGLMEQYYENGDLSSSQYFLDGVRQGRQEYFYAAKKLRSSLVYEKGFLQSARLYDIHGKLKREISS